jgi:hypothetical protein
MSNCSSGHRDITRILPCGFGLNLLRMSNCQSKKLVAYSFSESELEILQQNQDFMEHCENLKTADEFEQLCIIGAELLEKERD